MAFFDKFPVTLYDIKKDGNQKLVVDILRRIVFREELREEASLFYDYIIKDGETPEVVAHKFLGDTNLHWIILLLNEIVDPYFQWPLSDASFEKFTDDKYPGKAFYLGNDENLYFAKDEEVYVSSRDGTKHATIRGLVKYYDPTYRKLVLYNIVSPLTFAVGDIITGKTNSSVGTITRLVDLHSQAVHHFEDANTDYLYNPLDPLATPPVTGLQVAIGSTGSTFVNSEGGLSGATFGNTILYSYVNSLDASTITHSVVTNQEYERRLNETKRIVKILRDDYVPTVMDEFERIVK